MHGGALEDDAGMLVFGAQDDVVSPSTAERRDAAGGSRRGADVDAPVTLLADGELVVGSDDGKVYLLRGD